MSLSTDVAYFNHSFFISPPSTRSCFIAHVKHYTNGPRIHLVSYEKSDQEYKKIGEMIITPNEYNALLSHQSQINAICNPDYASISETKKRRPKVKMGTKTLKYYPDII